MLRFGFSAAVKRVQNGVEKRVRILAQLAGEILSDFISIKVMKCPKALLRFIVRNTVPFSFVRSYNLLSSVKNLSGSTLMVGNSRQDENLKTGVRTSKRDALSAITYNDYESIPMHRHSNSVLKLKARPEESS